MPDLEGRLDERFYDRQGFPSGVYLCTPRPVAGSSPWSRGGIVDGPRVTSAPAS